MSFQIWLFAVSFFNFLEGHLKNPIPIHQEETHIYHKAFPCLPKSSKYLVRRCFEPPKTFLGGVWESKRPLTSYLEDEGFIVPKSQTVASGKLSGWWLSFKPCICVSQFGNHFPRHRGRNKCKVDTTMFLEHVRWMG